MKFKNLKFMVVFFSFILFFFVNGMSDYFHHHNSFDEYNSENCFFTEFSLTAVSTTPDFDKSSELILNIEFYEISWIQKDEIYLSTEKSSQSARAPPKSLI